MKRKVLIVFLCYVSTYVYSDELSDAWKEIKGTAKKTWHGAENMGKGFVQSFGVALPEYKYSYKIFNDASDPVLGVEFKIINFMGSRFQGKISKHKVLLPMQNSGDAFLDRQLYFSVFICTTDDKKEIYKYSDARDDWAKWGAVAGVAGGPSALLSVPLGAVVGAIAGSEHTLHTLKKYKILQDVVYPWQPHDKNIYFYRAYSDKGKIKGEYLHNKTETTHFLGQFYNSSDKDAYVRFTKDDEEFTVMLEHKSFNTLSSSSLKHSIRPPEGTDRAFVFYSDKPYNKKNQCAYIPIPSIGIGYPITDQQKKNNNGKPVVNSMLYTYEVFEDKNELAVGLQGLSIGHFDQPVSSRVRDINPVNCQVWFKSPETKKSDDTSFMRSPINDYEQLWVCYITNDSVVQEKLVPGKLTKFAVIRPRIEEQKAYLYVLSFPLSAKKETVQLFLKQLGDTQQHETKEMINILDPQYAERIKKVFQPGIKPFIKNDEQNLVAAVRLKDTFFSQGVGNGPFYYEIQPDYIRIDQFAQVVYFDEDWYKQDPKTGAFTLKDDVFSQLYKKLPLWIKNYRTSSASVRQELLEFLKTYGNKQLFKGNKLTPQGQQHMQLLISGPISIKQPPVERSAGTNYYVLGLGQKPDSWPTN